MVTVPNSTVPVTTGALKAARDWYQFFAEVGRLVTERLTGDGGSLTIASGAITVSRFGLVTVDTEAAASTDDLVTINGNKVGAIIVLRQAADARDVTVKDGTGNLSLAGDCAFTDADDTLTLVGTSTGWLEIARSNNA